MGEINQGRTASLARLLGLMDNAIETNSRLFDDNGYAPTSGRVDLMYVYAYRDLLVTQLGSMTRQTAVGVLTATRKGIYTVGANGDLTLAARTAQQTAGVYTAANTEYVAPLNTTGGFPASFRFVHGQVYVFAHHISWTTSGPTLKSYATNIPSATLARSPRVAGGLGGQSDLPASIAAGSIAASTGAVSMFALP